MGEAARAPITTILFTDLVDSTTLMQRVGDERAQKLFETHHQLLSDAVSAHGGSELQWLGDGLMVAFASTADAVRCAIAMQQAAGQQPGERLAIRVGLNVGEVLQQKTGSGYFGTPVVVARRLCDRAAAGQILCSQAVSLLLAGRAAFAFREVGAVELKGIVDKVGVCEVVYAAERTAALFARTPFAGRRGELERLQRRLEAARSGRGGLAFVIGEPGIGKTRLLEEFTARARSRGAQVLWGRCFEGELSRPFGPFAEAIASYAKESDTEVMREEVSTFGGVLAKIAPELREKLPDLPVPEALAPEEERYRLLDAVAQALWALARKAPLVLVLDDLHWADGATLVLLRHLSRFLSRHPALILGAYRDVELDRQHPLGDALVALRREVDFERITLSGLAREAVTELLEAITRHEVPANFVEAITAETGGNPFFLREVLLHLLEEGKLEREAGRFATRFSIEEMGIPEGVRQVIERRLSRLSHEGNRLLASASGCAGAFRFEIAAAAADLDERSALDALDEALEAQLLCTTGAAEVYDFTHALIRHTLYSELNPSRQVRLHRRLAEEMERRYGEQAAEHALEIARQWHRSASLPGADRGGPHCLAAADRAEQAAAHEEAVTALRMALDLLPAGDARRSRLLARLGLALAWSLQNEEAVRVASEAGELLAASEGSDAAAGYLADAATAVYSSGFDPRAWVLAEQGLRHLGARRDLTWARLASYDLDRRDAHNPEYRGIPLDIPERSEVSRILLANWHTLIDRGLSRPFTNAVAFFVSREEAIGRGGSLSPVMAYWTGDYARAAMRANHDASVALRLGRLAPAALYFATMAHCQSALGDLSASLEAFTRAMELAERAGNPTYLASLLATVQFNHTLVVGEGQRPLLQVIQQRLAAQDPRPSSLFRSAWAALLCAYEGRGQESLQALERTVPALERAPSWVMHYTQILYRMIEALWVLGRLDHADVLERNLREKTLAPDFRYVHTDARLALARLCALTGRFDEGREWFEKARHVLDEQGARPLRAIVDFDEAWMEVRRGRAGNPQRALVLLAAARGPFESIGMPGWLRRSEELTQQLGRYEF
jgi:class 3 adenylate cyclase/tetratricopeptide (TPR) repeat protein